MSSISSIISQDKPDDNQQLNPSPVLHEQHQQFQVQQQQPQPQNPPQLTTNTSSESDVTGSIADEQSKELQQRKRSKVSRACDECRRKKIRCDALLNPVTNNLEKGCTSCSKNNFICSFDRVPMKRGPTKGYSKVDTISRNRSRTSSLDSQHQSAQNQHHIQHQHQQQPQTHALQQQPITLPPLTSITGAFQQSQLPIPQQPLKTSTSQPQLSQPTSPRKLSFDRMSNPNPNPIIPQSQFWKVPHEPPFDRRGSVDSISSSISESRFTFPQSNPQFSIRPSKYSESSVISDSEDDLRSASSPRNSIDYRGNRSRSNSQNIQQVPIPTSPSINNYAFQQQQAQQKVINTSHLIDTYYKFIHPNMPILPLNNQSLLNILSKPSPILQNEFDELNHFIIASFYNSLELLVTIISKNRLTSSANNSSVNLSSTNQNNQLLASINALFISLSKIFNKVVLDFEKFQQQTIILFFSTLVILSYGIVLLGDSTDVFIINSSVMLFNRLKIYKLFWADNLEQRTVNDNFDDYHFQLRRLWMNLNTLFSLHCISHGLPRNTVFDLNLIQIDKNFPLISGADQMKDVLKLGWLFSKISSFRNFNNDILTKRSFLKEYLQNELHFSNVRELFNHANANHNSLSLQFFEFIIYKSEIVEFLQEIQTYRTSNTITDTKVLFDFQLKLSNLIQKQLNIQGEIFSVIENNTNSIDLNLITNTPTPSLMISPLLPLVFKQSIKNLNILKILINSLQYNESLIAHVSKLLNKLIKLTNILSLIKPFIANELNDHINFKIDSPFLERWESLENQEGELNWANKNEFTLKVQQYWYGLMFDVLKLARTEDYEGWF